MVCQTKLMLKLVTFDVEQHDTQQDVNIKFNYTYSNDKYN